VTWAAIVGAGLATYLTRVLPLVVSFRRPMPPALARYLDALPIAIIAALVGPGLVTPGGAVTGGAEPLAALVVAVTVWWRRNLLLGVLVGVAGVALLRGAGLG
jgi:branched-subunit amino acid transport protein